MSLQFLKFWDMPLQFAYFKTCHYNSSFFESCHFICLWCSLTYSQTHVFSYGWKYFCCFSPSLTREAHTLASPSTCGASSSFYLQHRGWWWSPPLTHTGLLRSPAQESSWRPAAHGGGGGPHLHMENPVELRAARGEVKLGRPPPVVRRRERGELGATRLGWSSGGTGSSEWYPAGRGGADGREW